VFPAGDPLAAAAPQPVSAENRDCFPSCPAARAAQQDTQSTKASGPKAVALLAFGSAGVSRGEIRRGGQADSNSGKPAVSGLGVVISVIGMLTAAAVSQHATHFHGPLGALPGRRGCDVQASAHRTFARIRHETTAIAGAVAVPVAVAMLLSSFLVGINRGSAKSLAQAQGKRPSGG